MTVDEPREGRQLAGAKTSEEERAGTEQLLVYILDGTIQLEHEAAPAGDVRLVVMNQGQVAYGFNMKVDAESSRANHGGTDSDVAGWDRIEPGNTGEVLLDLREGNYVLTALDAQGSALSTASLTVQPQQGLPGSGDSRGVQQNGQ
jgi:hypothetical protein